MRLALLVFTGLLAQTAAAQTPCVDGEAGGYPCNRISLAAHIPVSAFGATGEPTFYNNDIWGWTDPETGREYALVGSDNRTSFVDVTVPAAPVIVGSLPATLFSAIHRDIKVDGDFAFITAETEGHGMQVFDLRRLRGVTSPPETFTADGLYTGIGQAHNVVIHEAADLAVVAGSRQAGFACNGGGLHLVDISTPTAPTFAGCYDGSGYTHDAQCLRYDGPDADYQGRDICVGYNRDRVAIVDVTDPASATLITEAFYPNPGYTHQGWFTDDKRYILVNDEQDEDGTTPTRTIVLDLADLDDPTFEFFHFGSTTAIDHNLYTLGDLVFQSNYSAGLQILDASGIAAGMLEEVASFDTAPDGALLGQWSNYPYFASGTVVVNDFDTGFFVLLPDPALLLADGGVPDRSAGLSPPRPNPTAGPAALTLTVETAQAVRADVYDVSGRRVATVFDGTAVPGAPVTLTVEASELPAGVYLIRAQGETFDASQRLTLVR